VRVSGRPLSFSSGPGRAPQSTLDRLTACNEAGLPILAQIPARPIGVLLGLQNTLNPFMLNPVWQQVAGLPAAEQAARMADPRFRAAVLAVQNEEIPDSLIGGQLIHRYDVMFELTDPPNYEPSLENSVAALARRQGPSSNSAVAAATARSTSTGPAWAMVAERSRMSPASLCTVMDRPRSGARPQATSCLASCATVRSSGVTMTRPRKSSLAKPNR